MTKFIVSVPEMHWNNVKVEANSAKEAFDYNTKWLLSHNRFLGSTGDCN